MMRNKVEEFGDWKKAVKAKMNDIKNIRIVYEVVMFLSGEQTSYTINQNDMRNIIRAKVGWYWWNMNLKIKNNMLLTNLKVIHYFFIFISYSYFFSCMIKPSFGETYLLFLFTYVRAYWHDILYLYIINANIIVALLDLPFAQCTNTLCFDSKTF